MQESPVTVSRDFPKPLDIAQVCAYGLSILSAGLFLFLAFLAIASGNWAYR